jgi:hypothetical protein
MGQKVHTISENRLFKGLKTRIARRRIEVPGTSNPADFVSLWLIDAEIA